MHDHWMRANLALQIICWIEIVGFMLAWATERLPWEFALGLGFTCYVVAVRAGEARRIEREGLRHGH